MINLTKLFNIKGFIATIEFSNNKKATVKQGNINNKIASLIADIRLANAMLSFMQAHYFTKYIDIKKFYNLKSFVISGSTINPCVWYGVALLVENYYVNFNKIFKPFPKPLI